MFQPQQRTAVGPQQYTYTPYYYQPYQTNGFDMSSMMNMIMMIVMMGIMVAMLRPMMKGFGA
jgi:hypothetical protein